MIATLFNYRLGIDIINKIDMLLCCSFVSLEKNKLRSTIWRYYVMKYGQASLELENHQELK